LPDFVIQTPLTPSLLRIRVAAPLCEGVIARRLAHRVSDVLWLM
jgi:hypothetical protein